MKKLLAIFLAILMLASFAACGKEADKSKSDETTKAEETTSNEIDEKEIANIVRSYYKCMYAGDIKASSEYAIMNLYDLQIAYISHLTDEELRAEFDNYEEGVKSRLGKTIKINNVDEYMEAYGEIVGFMYSDGETPDLPNVKVFGKVDLGDSEDYQAFDDFLYRVDDFYHISVDMSKITAAYKIYISWGEGDLDNYESYVVNYDGQWKLVA